MSRFVPFALAAAVLALSATPSPAQIYPLTNGPDGTAPNTVDSRRGFIGGNAVASEREFLYHPERAGNAAAELGVAAAPASGVAADAAAPSPRRARHHHRRESLR